MIGVVEPKAEQASGAEGLERPEQIACGISCVGKGLCGSPASRTMPRESSACVKAPDRARNLVKALRRRIECYSQITDG